MSYPSHRYGWDYQEMSEPEPGSIAVGYVCHGFQSPNPATFAVQKQCIAELAEKKGWKISRWYEEPGQNAVSESVEQRPVLTQLLSDAEHHFQVVLCFAASYWSRRMDVSYPLFNQLQRQQVWWATADGLWDTNKVWYDGIDTCSVLQSRSSKKSRRASSQESRKDAN